MLEELTEHRLQNRLRDLFTALERMRPVHQHLRLDDRNDVLLLAERCIAGERVRIRLDRKSARDAGADVDDRTPFGETRPELAVLGQAFAQAIGDKSGTRRFGDALIPMDETLVQAAVDLSGRPYLVHHEPAGAPSTIGPDYATTLTRHVFESFVHHAGIALHVTVQGGRDWHHITEAQYKAVARALRQAVERDPRVTGVPSTKGTL